MLKIFESVFFTVQLNGLKFPQVDFNFTTFHLAHNLGLEIPSYIRMKILKVSKLQIRISLAGVA